MKKILSTMVLASIITLCMTSQAFAASRGGNALVKQVRVDASGYGYILLKDIKWSPNAASAPSCVDSGYTDAIGFDTNTQGGQSILSAALAANLSGRRVQFSTKQLCAPYNVVQAANILVLKDY